ncbi:MAG: hypothetical protein IJR14_03015 [Synergistaceae bacterium]|nr:hypothetical protein [Synergistaceae bacterium]
MMSFEFTTGKGNKVQIHVVATKCVVRVKEPIVTSLRSIGDHIAADYRAEVFVEGKKVAWGDGSKPSRCWRADPIGPIAAKKAGLPEDTKLAQIGGKKFIIPADELDRYAAFLADVEASGETDETRAFRAEVEAEERKAEAARLEERIAEAEAQTDLPATKAEAAKAEKAQKAFLAKEHDEDWAGFGGHHIYSAEELDEMRARLAELGKDA